VSEAGVECGVIGDALVDEVGGGPGGLACREPNGIDGLLWSEGLVSHDAINDFGEVIVEEAELERPIDAGVGAAEGIESIGCRLGISYRLIVSCRFLVAGCRLVAGWGAGGRGLLWLCRVPPDSEQWISKRWSGQNEQVWTWIC
jgi:hypothetical protein